MRHHHRGSDPGARGDLGAGTVTVLASVGTALVLLVGALGLGTTAVSAARAGAAADLAALSAADAFRGLHPADPCALADQTVARHGASLTQCELQEGGTVLVSVSLPTALPWPAEGIARAGPPPMSGLR